MNSTIVFSLTVTDVGDMPPYWVTQVSVIHIQEELDEVSTIMDVIKSGKY